MGLILGTSSADWVEGIFHPLTQLLRLAFAQFVQYNLHPRQALPLLRTSPECFTINHGRIRSDSPEDVSYIKGVMHGCVAGLPACAHW